MPPCRKLTSEPYHCRIPLHVRRRMYKRTNIALFTSTACMTFDLHTAKLTIHSDIRSHAISVCLQSSCTSFVCYLQVSVSSRLYKRLVCICHSIPRPAYAILVSAVLNSVDMRYLVSNSVFPFCCQNIRSYGTVRCSYAVCVLTYI